MHHLRKVIGTCLCAAFLTACGGSNGTLAPSRTASAVQPSHRATGAQRVYVGSVDFLYGGNNSINMYPPGKINVSDRITNGVYDSRAFVFDASGNLYAAYYGEAHTARSSVTEYTGHYPARVIHKGVGYAVALALDQQDNVYVANTDGGGSVTVYAPGSVEVLRTILQGVVVPVALIFDAAENLYVANLGNPSSVTVYAPGSGDVMMTISDHVSAPVALAFGPDGDLYVANRSGNSVTVYAAGSATLLRTISQGVNSPNALAFDSAGYLYVANGKPGKGNVTVYAPGADQVSRTLTGVGSPLQLAFDGSGRLYVQGPRRVGIYGVGRSKPSKILSTYYLWYPTALVVGP